MASSARPRSAGDEGKAGEAVSALRVRSRAVDQRDGLIAPVAAGTGPKIVRLRVQREAASRARAIGDGAGGLRVRWQGVPWVDSVDVVRAGGGMRLKVMLLALEVGYSLVMPLRVLLLAMLCSFAAPPARSFNSKR